MDLRHLTATPTSEERAAVDAVLGPAPEDSPTLSASATGKRRTFLLPALVSVQRRIGHLSQGGLGYACQRLGVPPAEAFGVASFYALLSLGERPRAFAHVCDDIACAAAGAQKLCAEVEAKLGPSAAQAHRAEPGQHGTAQGARWAKSPCLGLCEQAPAALVTVARPAPLEQAFGDATVERIEAALNGEPVEQAPLVFGGEGPRRLLARAGKVNPESLTDYRAHGGYAALARALQLGPEAVVQEVSGAKLVGRGGAAFPTGRKWEAVAKATARPKYVVCNADESEPGTFKDRVLLELDPFSIVESMTVAGFATGAEKGFIYIRGEYPLCLARVENAIAQATAAGLLGANALGPGKPFDLEVRRGAGAYICGEETALFASIEGFRGEPRSKPPFPVQHGLFGQPTAINNVETLVATLDIVRDGAAAYASVGTAGSPGTKLFCVSGKVARPGIYEVPFGTRLDALIALAGGVPGGRPLTGVLLGGAAGTFLNPQQLSVQLSFEHTREAGTTLGSGVVLVLDDSVPLMPLLRRIAEFFRDESCGQCVPCRVGTVRQEELLSRLARGSPLKSVEAEQALFAELAQAMRDASICGLGQTAASAIESAFKNLPVLPGVAMSGAGKVEVTIDGQATSVSEGATLLDACRTVGVHVPTFCWAENLTPVNVCRICVVEVEGARVLAPACSRKCESGMAVRTDSPRVQLSRKLVLELLGSSVDMSQAEDFAPLAKQYQAKPERFGPRQKSGSGSIAPPGHHQVPDGATAATLAQPVKVDNPLFVRDYERCMLCYKCVEACGTDAQNTFAIAVAGRGFDARIATEHEVALPDSACVFCGNCVGVCPTGALKFKTEHDLRAEGRWDESKQTVTDTVCAYCGVGCTLSIRVQDNAIVRVTSPSDSTVTGGHLCIKGRFGSNFVEAGLADKKR